MSHRQPPDPDHVSALAESFEQQGVFSSRRRRALRTGLAMAIAAPVSALAQALGGKTFRIGFIGPGPGIEASEEAFRERLRELGHVEGKNIQIEWRFAKGDQSRFEVFAKELVGLQVDCIVAVGVNAGLASKAATSVIPIVLGNADEDPVRLGLVASLAKPGGNVTGAISIAWELAAKRVEILKDALPKASRVAILWDESGPAATLSHIERTEAAASQLKLRLQKLPVGNPETLETKFREASTARADAMIVIVIGSMIGLRPRIIELAGKYRMPLMATHAAFADGGGLMSYGADIAAVRRSAATYVDRILKGTKPSDLPIDQPTRFQLVINMKAAKALGIAIPQSLLLRADRVVA